MDGLLPDSVSRFWGSLTASDPRPGLHPIPGTIPLTLEAAICPPLLYYVALLFLPPAPPSSLDSTFIRILRNVLALVASFLFFRLPLAYHVPQSIGLTYQLGLVGLYGGFRVLDAFFVSVYLFDHVPRRVAYKHTPRPATPDPHDEIYKEWTDGGQTDPFLGKDYANGRILTSRDEIKPNGHAASAKSSDTNDATRQKARPKRRSSLAVPYYFLSSAIAGPDPLPVFESAESEDGWPHSFSDRASWALELELSMRGVGFTWTTADVRHTHNTWLPTAGNRMHSILVHVLPVTVVSGGIIRQIYTRYLATEPNLFSPALANSSPPTMANPLTTSGHEVFDTHLTVPLQILLTACLGAFLMSAFSLAHSMFAIALSPLSPSPFAFFPPLYTTRVWDLTSVRKFWSFGWHRLFARLFLVWGVWPGEFLERKLTGKTPDQPADIGKVLGAFLSSAFVHSFSVRGVLGGSWRAASGEAWFFALNGTAVVVEGLVQRVVRSVRRRFGWSEKMWYDAWIGRVWWVAVLMWTGRNFARGWVKSSLVREMAGL